MQRPRRFALVVATLLIAAAAIVVYGEDQPAQLHVSVTGLPAGTTAKVTVSGPDGTAYTIAGSDKRDVPPGPYTVSIHRVHVGQVSHYPVVDHHRVQVAPGKTASTTVAYQVAIPDSTKVLSPASDIVQVEGSQVMLRTDSPHGRQLAPGYYLISGEGQNVKHMLVRRVKSVGRRGGHIIVDTVPARLDEALPAGVVRIEKASLVLLRPAAHISGSGYNDPISKIEFSLGARNGACATNGAPYPASISSKVSYQLDAAHLDLEGDIAWDITAWDPWASASVGARLTIDHSLRADIEAAISCEVEKERDINVGCASFTGYIARVGPLTFQCDFKITGKVAAETKATWHTDNIQMHTTVGFRSSFHTKHGIHVDPTLGNALIGKRPDLPGQVSSFGASMGLHLGLKAQDIGGIARLELGLQISAGPKVTATLDKFRGTLEVVPKLVAAANLGKGPIHVGMDAEIKLPGLAATLWEVNRPSPLPTSSPTPRMRQSVATIPAAFVGKWTAHSAYLRTTLNGEATFEWRDYNSPPFKINIIQMRLHTNRDGIPEGRVTKSNTSQVRVGASVRLRKLENHTIQIIVNRKHLTTVCGFDAPAAHCGA